MISMIGAALVHDIAVHQSLSRSLVPTNLPVPLDMDLLLTPSEHVLRNDVANRAFPANAVVMLDVAVP